MKKYQSMSLIILAVLVMCYSDQSFSEPGEPGPFYRCIHTDPSGSEQFWVTQADWFCEIKHSQLEPHGPCDDATNDGNSGGGGYCGGGGNQSGEDCVITAEPVD